MKKKVMKSEILNKMNKKAEMENIIKIILWIVFLVIALGALAYFLKVFLIK